MNLDQTILNWAFSIAGALGSFVLKALWDAMTQLRLDNATLVKQIGELSDKIGREYVRRDDFKDHAARVEEMLARIFEKLDGKADKRLAARVAR